MLSVQDQIFARLSRERGAMDCIRARSILLSNGWSQGDVDGHLDAALERLSREKMRADRRSRDTIDPDVLRRRISQQKRRLAILERQLLALEDTG